MSDRENELARSRNMIAGVAGFVVFGFSVGVLVGGLPYRPDVAHWHFTVFVAGTITGIACFVVGIVIIMRDTSRLRRIGDALRERHEALKARRLRTSTPT